MGLRGRLGLGFLMKAKLTNLVFVGVLVLAFSVYVAGLDRSTDGGNVNTAAEGDGVTFYSDEPFAGADEGLTFVPDAALAGFLAGEGLEGDDETAEVADADAAPGDPTPTRTPTPINIGNFVWDDIDGDGRQDAGEPGLEGYTVQLWNAAKTALLDADVTDSGGFYTVIAPIPGNYRIRVILASGADQFSPKDSAAAGDQLDSDINPTGADSGFTDVVNLAPNLISTTTIDAGVIRFVTPTPTRTPTPINIGNFVWDDIDGDGRQDAGEPGLEGYTVQLWNAAKDQLLDTDVTDANGTYNVIAPIPGNYRVRVILASGADQFSPKDSAAAGDLLDSDINPTGVSAGFTDTFNLASNVISITSIDAGVIRFVTPTPTRTPTPINIGDFVWDDLDGDGIQDSGEPGIPGVRVQLWNSTMTSLIDQDLTDGNGRYAVIAPTPGTVRVRVLLPHAGAAFSPKDAGVNDQVDSDINPSDPAFGFTDSFVLASNLISTTVVDAGILDYDETLVTTTTTTSTTTSTTSTTTTSTTTTSTTTTTTPTTTTTTSSTTTTSPTTTTTQPDGSTTTTVPDGSTTTTTAPDGSTTTTEPGATTTAPDGSTSTTEAGGATTTAPDGSTSTTVPGATTTTPDPGTSTTAPGVPGTGMPGPGVPGTGMPGPGSAVGSGGVDGSGPGGVGGGALPRTGSEPEPLAVAGLVALALGGAGIVLARQRRRTALG